MFFIKDLLKIKSDLEYNYCNILQGGDCKERIFNYNNFLMCDDINFFVSNRKLLLDLYVCNYICRIRKKLGKGNKYQYVWKIIICN